jgi:betaine reductase
METMGDSESKPEGLLTARPSSRLKVVHYVNQFFAGVGGEESARTAPYEESGPVGPGRLLQRLLGDTAEVIATVVCGDNYFVEHVDEASESVLGMIQRHEPDLVIVGPAFMSGRYGIACATISAACEASGLAAVTGMHPENPAWDDTTLRVSVIAVQTTDRGSGMARAMDAMVRVGLKRAQGEALGSPEEEGILSRGIRVNVLRKERAAVRAVDGLLSKLAAEPYSTELSAPTYEQVMAPVLERPLSETEVALVTEASVVPAGNPDHLESARGTRWLKYPLEGILDLRAGEYVTVHGGFDNTEVNEDPDRVLPLDVLRELVAEGRLGKLHDHYYVTTGMATAVEAAEQIGREIAADLLKQRVHAALVTST